MRFFIVSFFVVAIVIGGSMYPEFFRLEIEGAWYVKLLLFIAFFFLVQLCKLLASILTVLIVPNEKGRITYSVLFFTLIAAVLAISGALFDTFDFTIGGIMLISFFFAALELIRDDKQQASS